MLASLGRTAADQRDRLQSVLADIDGLMLAQATRFESAFDERRAEIHGKIEDAVAALSHNTDATQESLNGIAHYLDQSFSEHHAVLSASGERLAADLDERLAAHRAAFASTDAVFEASSARQQAALAAAQERLTALMEQHAEADGIHHVGCERTISCGPSRTADGRLPKPGNGWQPPSTTGLSRLMARS